jgi:hypothetical protein
MTPLIHQRCWNHGAREAVVRCPECARFYCRECVTEHRGRMMCASCVAAFAAVPVAPRSNVMAWAAFAVGGILLAWLIFYYLGAMLTRIPADFFDKPA